MKKHTEPNVKKSVPNIVRPVSPLKGRAARTHLQQQKEQDEMRQELLRHK